VELAVLSRELGGSTFEENQDFFKEAAERERWGVRKVKKGEWLHMPDAEEKDQDSESEPLLSRTTEYVSCFGTHASS